MAGGFAGELEVCQQSGGFVREVSILLLGRRFCIKLSVLSENGRSSVGLVIFYYFFEDFCLRPAIFLFSAIFLLEQSNLTATTCSLNFIHEICSSCRKLAVSKKIKKVSPKFCSRKTSCL